VREEVITLTQKEHERLLVIRKVLKRELRQKDTALLIVSAIMQYLPFAVIEKLPPDLKGVNR